jgi:glycosyltransferase involved in cell wall biosynthesis
MDVMPPASATSREVDCARPRFSVVVPVYNRARELRGLLDALGRQSFPRDRFEVVISDDGSTEDLLPILEDAAGRGLPIVYLRQGNRGPGPARNLALAHARGEIVAFTDSDCEPHPGWLAALDRAFAGRGLDLAGGPTDLAGGHRLAGRCMSFLISSSLGGGSAFDPRCVLRMAYHPRGMNLAVRREVALAAGGFPSHAYGEDLEFSHRVARLGVRPAFVSDASVLHHELRGLVGVFLKNFHKGAARIRLRKFCDMHDIKHAIPTALVISLLVSATMMLLWPSVRMFAAVPWVVYVMALTAVAIQGALGLGEPLAAAVVPCYALMIHLGYGLGYLAAVIGAVDVHADLHPADWDALRSNEGRSPRVLGPCDGRRPSPGYGVLPRGPAAGRAARS